MLNLLLSMMLMLIVGCSSAPQPPAVSLAGDVDPVNFYTTPIRNTVITSQQTQGYWRKQFVYSIDNHNPSPEFFYAIAHADQIIAHIKPPFTNHVFNRLQTDLRKYGIVTPVELFVVEESDQQPQVILDCVKFGDAPEF